MAYKWLKVALFALFLAILVPRVIRLVQLMKFGKVVYNHQPGPCQLIKGIEHGSEDMHLLPNGLVFISSGLRFDVDVSVEPWVSRKGQIMLFDTSNPDKAAVSLQIDGKLNIDNFNPHGISVWIGEKGEESSLFVVNHPIGEDGDTVERFTFDVSKLTVLHHQETITGVHFPNDLVAVGPRQFYYTKFREYRGLKAQLEMYGLFRWGGIVLYDGVGESLVVDGLQMPNGINKSPDGRYIYVASVGEEEGIIIYERQPDNGLVQKKGYTIHAGLVDNIEVDPATGHLWLGVQPILHQMLDHVKNPSKAAASQVLHLKIKDGYVTEITDVYAEDGTKFISGSTIAIHYRGKLLVGTVNNKAVVCEIMYLN